MSVDITEQGLLHIVIDSSGYKDMAAGFPIFQLDDMESSDKQLTYSDLHGYTRDYAKTQIFQVSPAIITEIEAERDEKHSQYVVEFLKKFSDIILSSSYAGSSNEYIQKGFKGVTRLVGRCQYYMADNHPGAMQHEKGYQVAMSIIDRYVYMSMVPRLKEYCGERSGQWAEDLYYAALDRLVMLQLQTIGGSNRDTHLAKMLSILDIHDPSGAKVKLSFCSKVFVCLEISFRVMNVLLLGYAFIMSSLSLAELFKYDYSEALRAVSVINTILLAVSFVLELADMGIRFGIIAASAQIASIIPGIGLGVMLLTFAFTIAELILKKDEVKPPIQLIIEEHLSKTVAALPEPPPDWEQTNLALA